MGLKDDNHVLFVNIHIYPQYSAFNDIILIPEDIDINIQHVKPEQGLSNTNTYDN